jgi:hypothetical protein
MNTNAVKLQPVFASPHVGLDEIVVTRLPMGGTSESSAFKKAFKTCFCAFPLKKGKAFFFGFYSSALYSRPLFRSLIQEKAEWVTFAKRRKSNQKVSLSGYRPNV